MAKQERENELDRTLDGFAKYDLTGKLGDPSSTGLSPELDELLANARPLSEIDLEGLGAAIRDLEHNDQDQV